MIRQLRRPSLVLLVLSLPPLVRLATWTSPAPQPVDLAAAAQGHALFEHVWTPDDPLAGAGDGLGPVFNASSCLACHRQGGIGGSGSRDNNVTTFTVLAQGRQPARQGVVHARATTNIFQEALSHVHPNLPAALPVPVSNPRPAGSSMPGCNLQTIVFPRGVHVSQRKTPALFGAKLIDDLPDRVIIAQERSQQLKWGMAPASGEALPVGRAFRTGGGRIGRFGWKAQTGSLADFVRAACANELGLGNPGQAQPRSMAQPAYEPPGLDLTAEQCRQLTSFIEALPRPVEKLPNDIDAQVLAVGGKQIFGKMGCADCHTPNVGSIEGLYSDLLLHRMGVELQGGGNYNDGPRPVPDDIDPDSLTHPSEWRTPPLWGVAQSAPYLHDGRAATLHDAIAQHGGQGASAANRFNHASAGEQLQLVAFLQTLQAPSDEAK
jgi:CxxC motif-containing protein (DUF1111 family)